MIRSLRLQVFWAPILLLAVGAAILGLEVRDRNRMTDRTLALTSMRQQLDRVVLRLSERHVRTVRRARHALLDPDPANQFRILSSTSAQYLREIERLAVEATRTIANIAVPDAHPRLEGDLTRLQSQIDRVLESAHAFAPTIDGLAEGLASEDPETILTAEQSFNRASDEMHEALRVCTRMVQVSSAWQAHHATNPIAPVPLPIWIALACMIPLALWISYRPLARMRSLALGTHQESRSDEEKALSDRLAQLSLDNTRIEAELTERTLEAERASQVSRRAERELALLRLYNENLVNSLRSAIVVTNAAGTITSFNRPARVLLDLDESALETSIENNPMYAALGKRSTNPGADLARALSDRTALQIDGLPYRNHDKELLLDVTIAPYLDESGSARGLLWVSDDVTDATRMKKQLLASERLAAVGRLSAQVAHEIRNPLSAIGLNAELLDEEFASSLPEPQRKEAAALLSAIASEIERLTHVTEGYLGLARLPRPDFHEVSINLVVTDLLNMLDEELKMYQISPSLELGTPAPMAWADPGQLRQALLNIVRNSREAMPNGGALTITTKANDSSSEIEVSDTGPGMQKNQVGRVFEPFYTTKPNGTGLGLSLTDQIISEHAGKIEIASTSEAGTTIRIALPLRPANIGAR